MLKIAPSILGADFSILKEQVVAVEKGGADYLHLDIMDGLFVPNISFGPALIASLRPHSKMLFDAHLMVENPARYIKDFKESGCDLITVHMEACRHIHRTIEQIKNLGLEAGVALNPATPLNTLEEILPFLDLVLIMTVNPGFGGQKFIPGGLDKIKRLKAYITSRKLRAEIQVDGGVTLENAALISAAGANILVAGAAVFKAENISTAIKKLRREGENGLGNIN
jgi:ribulose-phosphate 3-epimerase